MTVVPLYHGVVFVEYFFVLFALSISHVQRADAGQYRCRLSVSNTLIESDPIKVGVEGELILFISIHLLHPFAYVQCQHSASCFKSESTVL